MVPKPPTMGGGGRSKSGRAGLGRTVGLISTGGGKGGARFSLWRGSAGAPHAGRWARAAQRHRWHGGRRRRRRRGRHGGGSRCGAALGWGVGVCAGALAAGGTLGTGGAAGALTGAAAGGGALADIGAGAASAGAGRWFWRSSSRLVSRSMARMAMTLVRLVAVTRRSGAPTGPRQLMPPPGTAPATSAPSMSTPASSVWRVRSRLPKAPPARLPSPPAPATAGPRH